MINKIYVGSINGDNCEVFRSEIKPTEYTHRQYKYIIGPFKTIRGAKFCVNHIHGPYMTVKEFEQAAIIHQNQSSLCDSYIKHLDGIIHSK